MNQITLQQAPPRVGQSEALSDCVIAGLRRYDEHQCDVRRLAADTKIQRFRVPDSPIDFLKAL